MSCFSPWLSLLINPLNDLVVTNNMPITSHYIHSPFDPNDPIHPVFCRPQCLSFIGLAMVAFQVMVYPGLVKAMGIKYSQRLSSIVMVPMFAVIPLLSFLHDKGWVLVIANFVVLFIINAATSTVRFPASPETLPLTLIETRHILHNVKHTNTKRTS